MWWKVGISNPQAAKGRAPSVAQIGTQAGARTETEINRHFKSSELSIKTCLLLQLTFVQDWRNGHTRVYHTCYGQYINSAKYMSGQDQHC
eukprot:1146135-Pelagomonas_calceolata.AAC.14